MSEFLAELTSAAESPYYKADVAPLFQYVQTGKESDLQALVAAHKQRARRYYCFHSARQALPDYAKLPEEAYRFFRALTAVDDEGDVLQYFERQAAEHPEAAADVLAAYLRSYGTGPDARGLAGGGLMMLAEVPLTTSDGTPNAWGAFLLSLSDAELRGAGDRAMRSQNAFALIAQQAPQRLPAILKSFLQVGHPSNRRLCDENCAVLLALDVNRYAPTILEAIEQEPKFGRRAVVLKHFAERFPEKYVPIMRETALACARVPSWHQPFSQGAKQAEDSRDVNAALTWLFTHDGRGMLAEFDQDVRQGHYSLVMPVLRVASQVLAAGAAPLYAATTENPTAMLRSMAVHTLIEDELPEYDELINARLTQGLTTDDKTQFDLLLDYLKMIRPKQTQAVAPTLWKLLERRGVVHTRSRNRTAAATHRLVNRCGANPRSELGGNIRSASRPLRRRYVEPIGTLSSIRSAPSFVARPR